MLNQIHLLDFPLGENGSEQLAPSSDPLIKTEPPEDTEKKTDGKFHKFDCKIINFFEL